MAIPFSISLLLVALITTAASETPASPSPPLSLPETPPPAPPSPSPSTAPPPGIQEMQLRNILDALVGAGDFGGWASLLSSANPSALPLTATLFIPSNDAITRLLSTVAAAAQFDPLIIPYHIVPQRLTFADLQQFATHTRLPTLLPSKFIVVTNNSPSNFTLDGSRISQPDVFLNAAFALHGIDKILDYSVYSDGDGGGPLSPPPTQEPPAAGGKKRPVAPGGLTSSDACRPCTGITVMILSTSFWGLAIIFWPI